MLYCYFCEEALSCSTPSLICSHCSEKINVQKAIIMVNVTFALCKMWYVHMAIDVWECFLLLQQLSARAIKVVGHPARSAASLRIEIEWEICHVDLSLPSKSMAEIALQI